MFQMLCDYKFHTHIYTYTFELTGKKWKIGLFLGPIFLAKLGIAWNWNVIENLYGSLKYGSSKRPFFQNAY